MRAHHLSLFLLGTLTLAACGQSSTKTQHSDYVSSTLTTSAGPVNVTRAPNGTLIAGGDVALGDAPAEAFAGYFPAAGLSTQSFAEPASTALWSGNTIPYIINPNVDPKFLPLIKQAVQDYAAKTNLKLVARTKERTYVEIAGATNPSFCGLASSIGFYRSNTISSADRVTYGLSSGSTHYIILNNTDPYCSQDARVVIHEFGHIAGLRHEHSRPDRDNFVRIDLNALGGDPLYVDAYSFKYTDAGRSNAYDLASVMHYTAIFRKTGQQVIYPLDPTYPIQNVGGASLSSSDSTMLAALYPAATKPGRPK